MKIYTKHGDTGLTRLANGRQTDKDDLIIEALGSLDELNSAIGYAVSQHKVAPEILQTIQNNIFDIGAELALSKTTYDSISQDIKFLEDKIDFFQGDTPPLKNFILPGGSPASAWLHMCCTICRRAERAVISEIKQRRQQSPHLLSEGLEVRPVNMSLVTYLNRLSDFLFCLARHENHSSGMPDVLWKPKAKKA